MLRALLFDLDGTLSDTDPLHLRAWQQCLAGSGIKVDEAFYGSQITGRTTPAVVRQLFPGLAEPAVAEFSERKEATFRDLARGMTALAGLGEILALARARAWRCALVTNGSRENAGFMLRTIGLEARFDVMVFGQELRAGKPDPLPYRQALEELQIAPESAVAFEDSVTGLRSATSAGLRTVGVATSQSADELLAAGAMLVIRDFTDKRLGDFLG